MSGLAKLLKEQGEDVTGSDVKESSTTKALQEMGIPVSIGHEASLVQEGQSIVFSSDIAHENVELVKAKELSLPLMHRSELLAHITKTKKNGGSCWHARKDNDELASCVCDGKSSTFTFVFSGRDC